MEITERVPCTNKDGKEMKLTLDTETRKVKIDCPVVWGGSPEFDVTTLKARIDDMAMIAAEPMRAES